MSADFARVAERLSDHGWHVEAVNGQSEMPASVRTRYPWLPSEVQSFICSFRSIVSPSDKCWLVTSSDLSGDSGAAFAWNQWEVDSLSAAESDSDWQEAIIAFWNAHFPILISVKCGYAYAAIRVDGQIVIGEEPEFEETELFSGTFAAFLDAIVDGDMRLDRLV